MPSAGLQVTLILTAGTAASMIMIETSIQARTHTYNGHYDVAKRAQNDYGIDGVVTAPDTTPVQASG